MPSARARHKKRLYFGFRYSYRNRPLNVGGGGSAGAGGFKEVGGQRLGANAKTNCFVPKNGIAKTTLAPYTFNSFYKLATDHLTADLQQSQQILKKQNNINNKKQQLHDLNKCTQTQSKTFGATPPVNPWKLHCINLVYILLKSSPYLALIIIINKREMKSCNARKLPSLQKSSCAPTV